jgi:hypothetical protein
MSRKRLRLGTTMSSPEPVNPLPVAAAADGAADRAGAWAGALHVYVAFDWGDEVDLEHAGRLVPAAVHELPRRRRTPTSIAYRPPPLRFALAPVPLELAGLGSVPAAAEATVFDFAAVSVALHVPFRLSPEALSHLAGHLADPAGLVRAARVALEPLHCKLLPAVRDPLWKDDLSEEYVVFQLPPGAPLRPALLLEAHASRLAGWLLLEAGPLSAAEVAEALRLHLNYSPDDLFVPDWAAAVLLDADCEETLQTIEFANLQLLEYRHIDNRLDDNLAVASRLIHRTVQARLPFWRGHARSLRALGELKVEANDLFERTGNVLKLVGDQYLARVHRLLAARFHLKEWERSVQRKLEVAEGVYRVLFDQAVSYRMEFLEVIIILLIAFEVVWALFVRH